MAAIFSDDRTVGRFEPAMVGNSPAPFPPSADWCGRWITIFLAVGVAARLIRYLLRFPLWGDEAMLSMNLLDRDYAGLMQPLDFHQVAPLVFLWIEHTVVKLLGFQEWSLRLFPLVGSIASLFLFHRLARLLLRGTALVLAVAVFAATYSGLRYAAEVKPYSIDLMVSTLLLLLVARWWQQPADTRWLWTLTAVVPLALGLSYPAVFIAGGASLAVAAVLLGGRPLSIGPAPDLPGTADGSGERWRGWWTWAVFTLVLVGSFLAWYKIATGAQAGAELDVMGRMWDDTFPPRDSFVNVLAWLARVHAGPLLAVPVGGNHWGSIGTTLVCLVAVVIVIRQRRYRLLVLCLTPFALNLIAAAMRRFPYGGHMRLAMHLSPLVCILAAIGATAILQWFGRKRSTAWSPLDVDAFRGEPLTWPVATVMVGLLMLPALSTARDFYQPGKEQQEIRKRGFAVWFWGSMERDHEVVGISSDLKKIFVPPGDVWENCVSAQFLCNERIYSPRRARGQGYDLTRASRQRPLACVQYWSHCAPYDQAAFDRWLGEMKEHYDLIATQRYPMLQDNDDDRVPEPPDRVEVYEFVPRR